MERLVVGFVASLLVLGVTPVVSAGALEDANAAIQQMTTAINERNVDAFSALCAEDARWIAGANPFRIDGREAIRAFWAGLFNTFPTTRVVGRQSETVVHADNVATTSGYYTFTLIARDGKTTITHGRYIQTWVKTTGRWQLVAHHASPLPPPPSP